MGSGASVRPSFKVVIPARYASSRLPAKPLLDIGGKPMIAHVCQRAMEAHADEVVVATDDQRIVSVVEKLGIPVLLTATEHQSGTERIAEVAKKRRWSEEDIIVNLQGDEPFISAEYICQVAYSLATQTSANIATLATPIHTISDIFNPNIVKVVTNQQGYGLYFSRAAIPWDREQFSQISAQFPIETSPYLRHIGLYAYRQFFLQQYVLWEKSPLESIECLEQLRILWHGEKIKVEIVTKAPPTGIDTLEDLHRARAEFANNDSTLNP